jgi:hypothetical protein
MPRAHVLLVLPREEFVVGYLQCLVGFQTQMGEDGQVDPCRMPSVTRLISIFFLFDYMHWLVGLYRDVEAKEELF